MPVEKSAGAVVFHREASGKIEYLLLKHDEKYWNFPKGHIEKGEKLEEAALREVQEETGLKDVKIISGFKETIKYFLKVKYDYQLKRALKTDEWILKFVTYFLAEANDKNIVLSFEHLSYEWLKFDEAMERLKKYKSSQGVLKKADGFLNVK